VGLFEKIKWKRYVESPPFNVTSKKEKLSAKYCTTLHSILLPYSLVEEFKENQDYVVLFLLEEGMHAYVANFEGMSLLRSNEFSLNKKFVENVAAVNKNSPNDFLCDMKDLISEELKLQKRHNFVKSITEPLTTLCIERLLESKKIKINRKIRESYIDASLGRLNSLEKKVYDIVKNKTKTFEESFYHLARNLAMLDSIKLFDDATNKGPVDGFTFLETRKEPKKPRLLLNFLIRYKIFHIKLDLSILPKEVANLLHTIEKPYEINPWVLVLEKFADSHYKVETSLNKLIEKLLNRGPWKSREPLPPSELIIMKTASFFSCSFLPVILEENNKIKFITNRAIPNSLFSQWVFDFGVTFTKWYIESQIIKDKDLNLKCPFTEIYCLDCEGTNNRCFISKLISRISQIAESNCSN